MKRTLHMNRFGMKTIGKFPPSWMRSAVNGLAAGALPMLLVMLPVPAQASMFKGETLDAVANVLAWVVLLIVPIVAIVAFWLVHILPEKIAEKKHHPQAKAIQTLCLLSLAFGGLLWPLAWLWAYTKPVVYKMAYGTDKAEHGHEGAEVIPKEEGSEEGNHTR